VSLALAKLLKLQPKGKGGMEVIVASGDRIRSPGKCLQVPVELQGCNFYVDIYVLPLEGYGMVLGAQWLRGLGPILWDFEKLRMQFTWKANKILLYGVQHNRLTTK